MDSLATHAVSIARFDLRDAVGWAIRISNALVELHERGEPHGRISPDAVLAETPRCDAPALLRAAGDLSVAIAHHAPERLDDGRPSPEDDVWALAVLLYRVLTGSPPFGGTTRLELLAAIRAGPPAPLAVFDVGDDALQLVIDRAFAPGEARLRRIEELRAALIACDRSLGALPPLPLAEPLDEDSNEGAPTTVWKNEEAKLAAALARLRKRPVAPGSARVEPRREMPRTANDGASAEPHADEIREPVAAVSQARPLPRGLLFVLGAGCVAAGAGAALVTMSPKGRLGELAMTTATNRSEAPLTAPTGATSGAARHDARAPIDRPAASIAACLAPMFPEGTFDRGDPALAAVCEIDDPVRGAAELRTQVVVGGNGRGVTEAMREWSALGWYAMAAFAIARGRCCPVAEPLSSPEAVTACGIDQRLTELAGSVRRGDEVTAERALEGYGDAISCSYRAGDSSSYGQSTVPNRSELGVFRRIFERALTLRR